MHESGSTNIDLENEPEVEETSTSDDIENETEEPSVSFTSSPSDIAQGIGEKPVQPHNVTFPKENGRSFSVSWFSKHIRGWSILCPRMLPTVMLAVSFLVVSTKVMSALY